MNNNSLATCAIVSLIVGHITLCGVRSKLEKDLTVVFMNDLLVRYVLHINYSLRHHYCMLGSTSLVREYYRYQNLKNMSFKVCIKPKYNEMELLLKCSIIKV